jgi:hypothetical protein
MEATLFARKCSITGNGMNEGFVINGGEYYIAEEEDCKKLLRDKFNQTIEEAYKESEENGGDDFYWTEWEEPSEFQYIEIDGKLYEISEYFNQ